MSNLPLSGRCKIRAFDIFPIYKAIIRPPLEYCIQTWNQYIRKDIEMLDKIQRRATKLIPGLRDLIVMKND